MKGPLGLIAKIVLGLASLVYLTLRNGLMAILWVAILSCSFAIGFLYSVVKDMPLLESLTVPKPALASEFFTADGRTSLGRFYIDENRVLVSADAIPAVVKNAFVAIEDRTFYQHNGIELTAIARAAKANLTEGELAQGGSTITQQLVRNLYLTKQKKWIRKLQEIIIALRLEKKYSKDEILNFYLNEIYLGGGSYGVEAATRTYFNKELQDLTLAEAAMLAGMPQAPSRYDPYVNAEAALGRRNVVLGKMLELGYITQEEHDAAAAEPLAVAERAKGTGYKGLDHPWYAKPALDEAAELLGPEGRRQLKAGGLRIYTAMDLNMQGMAEEAVTQGVANFNPKMKIEQGALLAIDPHTGAVKACVGGIDFFETEFNRATQARRQPGSSFKPFVYLAALEQGFSPLSLCLDVPRTYTDDIGKVYQPRNYDGGFRGIMTMKSALEHSRNVVAVMTTDLVGPRAVAEVANKAGVLQNLPEYLSLALGAGEVTLLDLTSANATFASRGVYHEPYFVEAILDPRGRVLYQRRPQGDRVFQSKHVDMLNYMLQGVVVQGTGTRSKIDKPSAGKTGTTSDFVDAWFMGFTPELACGVWVGRDDNTPMASGVTGGHYPAVIWREFMSRATAGMPATQFPKPDMPRVTIALDPKYTQEQISAMQGHEDLMGLLETNPELEGIETIPPEKRGKRGKVDDEGGDPDGPPRVFF